MYKEEQAVKLRDINRIKPFLQKLEELWLANQDLRFSQLMNFLDFGNNTTYHMEDDEALKIIEKKLNE
jgi:hypothetical protein